MKSIRGGGPTVPMTFDGGRRVTFKDAYRMFDDACRAIADGRRHLQLLQNAKLLWHCAEANRRNRQDRGNLKGNVRSDPVMDWMTNLSKYIGRRPGQLARVAIDLGLCGAVPKGEPRARRIRKLSEKWKRRIPQ